LSIFVAEISNNGDDSVDLKSDSDFLTNVPRIQKKKVLDFGHGSGGHGRDSRYWDKDDRRRDGDYDEDMMEQTNKDPGDEIAEDDDAVKKDQDAKSSHDGLKRRGDGLYNEAGRHELKRYEAEYEASLKNLRHPTEDDGKLSHETDIDDEYDDFFDFNDAQLENTSYSKTTRGEHSNANGLGLDDEVQKQKESNDSLAEENNDDDVTSEDIEGASSLNKKNSLDGKTNSKHASIFNGQSTKKSHPETKKKGRRRKFSGEVHSF